MISVALLLLKLCESRSDLSLNVPQATQQKELWRQFRVEAASTGYLLAELWSHGAAGPLALMANREGAPRKEPAGFAADTVDSSGWTFNKSYHYLQLESGNWTLEVYSETPVSYDIQITYSQESACPRNCSGNGVCIRGRCSCTEHFIDGDCSLFTSRLVLESHIVIPTPSHTWCFLAIENTGGDLDLFVSISPATARAHLYLRCGDYSPLVPAGPGSATGSIEFSEEDEPEQVIGVPCSSGIVSMYNAGSDSVMLAFDAEKAPKKQKDDMVYIIVAVIIVISLSWSCAYVLNSSTRPRVSMAQTDVGGGLAEHVVNTMFPATEYQGEQKDMCPICLEHLVQGALIRTLVCKHVFHAACIDHWFLMHTVTLIQFCCVCKHDCSIQQSVIEESDTIALEEQ